MIDYKKYIIDYYTSTQDFDEALDMRLGIDIDDYAWKKMRHFKKGNIILVRNYKYGIDYLIQLIEDGREMTEDEKKSSGRWASQKYIAKYKIIAKDDEENVEKTRYIKKSIKDSILNDHDYMCQGSNKIMGETLKLREFKCDINFKESDHKPEFDHVNQFSDGGLTVKENLMPLCKGCHAMKTQFFSRDLLNQLVKVKHSPNVST